MKQTKPSRKFTPFDYRARIQHYKNEFPDHYEFPMRNPDETEEQYQKRRNGRIGAMNGEFGKILKEVIQAYPDEIKVDLSDRISLYRRLILSWVLTPDDDVFQDRSSSEYTDADWFAISKWQGSRKNEQTGKWELQPNFRDQVLQVLHCAKDDYVNTLKGDCVQSEFGVSPAEKAVQEVPSGLFIPEPFLADQTSIVDEESAGNQYTEIDTWPDEKFPYRETTQMIIDEVDPLDFE